MSRFATRDAAVSATAAELVGTEALAAPVLIMGDTEDALAAALRAAGVPFRRWLRRLVTGRDVAVSATPPDESAGSVVLRLPPSKDELQMSVAQAATRLAAGNLLHVVGANDEGIKSAGTALAPYFEPPTATVIANHCRVLSARRTETPTGGRADLAAWKTEVVETIGRTELRFVSYPGLFAHGRLDEASRFLLETLVFPETLAHAIDFGCGAGALSVGLRLQRPDLRLTLVDNDALALEAARENVPGADLRLARSLAEAAPETADLIVSNPPIHTGKAQTFAAVEALLADAPRALNRAGLLLMVVQRTVPVPKLAPHTLSTEIAAETASFRIYAGRKTAPQGRLRRGRIVRTADGDGDLT